MQAATDSSRYAIEVEALAKTFGNVRALDNMSFAVPEGVIAGFVGPNGSGKTTTMRILATLLKPDWGKARVFNLDTSSEHHGGAVRHSIGFMPDYFGLYPDMTAGEYLDFFAAAYRVGGDKRKTLVGDILELTGLGGKRDTLIAGLSRGMQQKLSLGRCLIHSPKLLLLDEPASGLDPRARIELMELLRELKNMGKTILISSHILSELHNLCEMVVIIEKGRTVYTGSVEEASAGVMEGRKFLELTVEGDPDTAVEVLNSIPGMVSIRRQQQRLLVEYDESMTSSALIGACVRGGIQLAEAKRGTANLEDIFMHLTRGE
jgi:ABC-2 type transport system ATP-binding protein